jgi:hypothetical protein
LKIAICTPHHSDVHAHFAFSLVQMVKWTVQAQITFNGAPTVPDIEIFFASSSALPTLRNTLVKDALDWGADYLLWADSDHEFPKDALLKLLGHNLPVVGVNYPRRGAPYLPTAAALNGAVYWTTEEMAKNGQVTEVGALGLGLCLMDMRIFDLLHQDALAAGKENFWPLFAFEPIPGEMDVLGEDIYFFRRVAKLGISIHVDHELSWSIGHASQKMLTNEDALPHLGTRKERQGEADPNGQ